MVTQSYPRWANRIARSGRKAVVLRRRRADIASARPDSILRIAAPPEHFTGAHASRTLRTKLLRLFKPIRALVVREGPRVRIHPPPAESLFLAGLYLRGSEPRLSARVSRLRSRRGRQRAAGPANIAPTRNSISVGLYSSTAFPAMRSRQVVGLKSQGGFPNEIGLALGLGMLVDLASSDCAQAKPSAAR